MEWCCSSCIASFKCEWTCEVSVWECLSVWVCVCDRRSSYHIISHHITLHQSINQSINRTWMDAIARGEVIQVPLVAINSVDNTITSTVCDLSIASLFITSFYFAWHHIIPHHITSYHIISHHITSTINQVTSNTMIEASIGDCYRWVIVLMCISHHLISYHITSHHIISHHITSSQSD